MRSFLASTAIALLLWGISCASPAAEAHPESDASVFSDLDIALKEDASRFKYYTMPTKGAGPCDLTTGPDGNIWVQDFLVNKIQRINPKTGKIDEFDIPYTAPLLPVKAPGRTGLTACAIQPGEDGNIYAATGVRNQFVKVDLATKNPKISVFDTGSPQNPLGNLQPFNDLWRGKDGMYFTQVTGNKLCLFNYKTEKITCWTPPTPLAGILGLFVASDGLLWFTEFFANKVGNFNMTSHEFNEYPVPILGQQPTVTRAETRTNGRNLVWWTNFIGQTMGSIDIHSHKIRTYPLAVPASFPVEDTTDSKGRVWYSTALSGTLNVLNPATGKSRAIPEGGLAANPPGLPPPANIAIHYGPGNKIWFTDLALNRVGTYQLKGCGKSLTKCTAYS